MPGVPPAPIVVRAVVLVSGVLAIGGCSEQPFDFFGDSGLPVCELDTNLLFTSVPADAIPSLIEPDMVTIGAVGTEYLLDSDRILGVVVDGQPRAYPHNVLWHHEIVSDRVGGEWVTATFCPLTGSGLVFRPSVRGELLDIGVSGLLFANNLVLYDRTSGDVYGPQLSVEGKCSRFRDESLELLPVQEMSWGRWRILHPNTTVVSSDTGFERNYRVSPYGDYDAIGNDDLLFEMDVDRSRPLKERVLAIRIGTGGKGYPFEALAQLGSVAALNEDVGGDPTVIFFEERDGGAAAAFDARVGAQTLTFDASPTGDWIDRETGSRWDMDGRAVDGPLLGERLEVRADAYTLFWFAWRHFQPAAAIWLP